MNHHSDPPTDSLTDVQLRSLLRLAVDPSDEPTPDDRLGRFQKSLDEVGKPMGVETAALLTRAINPKTPVKALRELKDLAKLLMQRSNDAPQREAATLLYHVAVVAALRHHGAAISTGPREQRRAAYRDLGATLEGHAIGDLLLWAAVQEIDERP